MIEVLLVGLGAIVVLGFIYGLIQWAIEDPVFFDDE